MIFFFKQKTAYEMRISDWSSDVCSSDLKAREGSLAHDAAEAIKRLTAEAEQIAMRLKETEAVRPDLDDRIARADIIARDAELDLARAMTKQASEQAELRVAQADLNTAQARLEDRQSTRLNYSHYCASRMPSS